MKRNSVVSSTVENIVPVCAPVFKGHAAKHNRLEISGSWLNVSCKFPCGRVCRPFILVACHSSSGEVLAQTITTAPGHEQDQIELIANALLCAGQLGIFIDEVLTDCGAGFPSQELISFCDQAGLKLIIRPAKRTYKVELYLSGMSLAVAYLLVGKTADLWNLTYVLETYRYMIYSAEIG